MAAQALARKRLGKSAVADSSDPEESPESQAVKAAAEEQEREAAAEKEARLAAEQAELELKRQRFEEDLERVDVPRHEPSMVLDVLTQTFSDLFQRPIVPKPKVASDNKTVANAASSSSGSSSGSGSSSASPTTVDDNSAGARPQSPGTATAATRVDDDDETTASLQRQLEMLNSPFAERRSMTRPSGSSTQPQLQSTQVHQGAQSGGGLPTTRRTVTGSVSSPVMASTRARGSSRESAVSSDLGGVSPATLPLVRKVDAAVAQVTQSPQPTNEAASSAESTTKGKEPTLDELIQTNHADALAARQLLPADALGEDVLEELRKLEKQSERVSDEVNQELTKVVNELRETSKQSEASTLESLRTFGVPPASSLQPSADSAGSGKSKPSVTPLGTDGAPHRARVPTPRLPVSMPTPLLAMHRNALRKSLRRLAHLANPRFNTIPVPDAPSASANDKTALSTTVSVSHPLSLVAKMTPEERLARLAEKKLGAMATGTLHPMYPKSVRCAGELTMRPEWTSSPIQPRPTYFSLSSISPNILKSDDVTKNVLASARREMSVHDFFSVSPSEVHFTTERMHPESTDDCELVAKISLRNVSAVSRRARVLPMRAPFFRAVLSTSPAPISQLADPIVTQQRGTGLIAPGLAAELHVYFKPTSHAVIRDTLVIETDAGRILVPVVANAEPSELLGLVSLFQFKPSPPLLAAESSFTLSNPSLASRKLRFYLCDVDSSQDVVAALTSRGLPLTSSFTVDAIRHLYAHEHSCPLEEGIPSLEDCEAWFDTWLYEQIEAISPSLVNVLYKPETEGFSIAIPGDSETTLNHIVLPYADAARECRLADMIALERYAGFVCGDDDVIARTEDARIQAISLSQTQGHQLIGDDQLQTDRIHNTRQAVARRSRLFALHRLRRSVISATLARRHMELFDPENPIAIPGIPPCEYFSLRSWEDAYECHKNEGIQNVKRVYRRDYGHKHRRSKGNPEVTRPETLLLAGTFAIAPRVFELDPGQSIDIQVVSWPPKAGHHMSTIALVADNGEFALVSISAAAHMPTLSLMTFANVALDVPLLQSSTTQQAPFPGTAPETPLPLELKPREVGASHPGLLQSVNSKQATSEVLHVLDAEALNGFLQSFVVQNTSLLSLPFRCTIEADTGSSEGDDASAFEVTPEAGIFEAHTAIKFHVRFAPQVGKHIGALSARLVLRLVSLPSSFEPVLDPKQVPALGSLKPFAVPGALVETEEERDAKFFYLRARRNADSLAAFVPGSSKQRAILSALKITATDGDKLDDEDDPFDDESDVDDDISDDDTAEAAEMSRALVQESGLGKWRLATGGTRAHTASDPSATETTVAFNRSRTVRISSAARPLSHTSDAAYHGQSVALTGSDQSGLMELPVLYVTLQGQGTIQPVTLAPEMVVFGPGSLVVGADSVSEVVVENRSEALHLLVKPAPEEWLAQPLPSDKPLPLAPKPEMLEVHLNTGTSHMQLFDFSDSPAISETNASPRAFATSSWLEKLRELIQAHQEARAGVRAPLTYADLVDLKVLVADAESNETFIVPPLQGLRFRMVITPKVPVSLTPAECRLPVYVARPVLSEGSRVEANRYDIKKPTWPIIPCVSPAADSTSVRFICMAGNAVSGRAVFVDTEVNFGVVNASGEKLTGGRGSTGASATARFRIRNPSSAPVPFVLVAQPAQGGNPVASSRQSGPDPHVKSGQGLRFIPSRGVLAPGETRVIEAIFKTPPTAIAVAQDLDCIIELHSAGCPARPCYLRALAQVRLPSVRLYRIANGREHLLPSSAADADLEQHECRVDVGTARVFGYWLENATPLETPFTFVELPLSEIGLKIPTQANTRSGSALVTLEPMSGVLAPNGRIKVVLTVVGLEAGVIQRMFVLDIRGLSARMTAPPLIALRGAIRPIQLGVQTLAPAHTNALIRAGLTAPPAGQGTAVALPSHPASASDSDTLEPTTQALTEFPVVAAKHLAEVGLGLLESQSRSERPEEINLGEDVDVAECVFRDILVSNPSACPLAIDFHFDQLGPLPEVAADKMEVPLPSGVAPLTAQSVALEASVEPLSKLAIRDPPSRPVVLKTAQLSLPTLSGAAKSMKRDVGELTPASPVSATLQSARANLKTKDVIMGHTTQVFAVPKLTNAYESSTRFTSMHGQAWLAQNNAEVAARRALARSGKSAAFWVRVLGAARVAALPEDESLEPVPTDEAWSSSSRLSALHSPKEYPTVASADPRAVQPLPYSASHRPTQLPAFSKKLSTLRRLPSLHSQRPHHHHHHHHHHHGHHHGHNHSTNSLHFSSSDFLMRQTTLFAPSSQENTTTIGSTELGPGERVPFAQPAILLPPRSVALVRVYARADAAAEYVDNLRITAKVDLGSLGARQTEVDAVEMRVHVVFSGLALRYCSTTTSGIIRAPPLALSLTRALIRSLPFPSAIRAVRERSRFLGLLGQSISSVAISATLAGSETPLGPKSVTDESLTNEGEWYTEEGAKRALDVKLGLRLDRTYAPMSSLGKEPPVGNVNYSALRSGMNSDILAATTLWARALLPAVSQKYLTQVRKSNSGRVATSDQDDKADYDDALIALAGLPITPLYAQAGQLGRLVQQILLPEADPSKNPSLYKSVLQAIQNYQAVSSVGRTVADLDSPELPSVQIADPIELYELLRALRLQAEAEPVWGPCFPLLPWRLAEPVSLHRLKTGTPSVGGASLSKVTELTSGTSHESDEEVADEVDYEVSTQRTGAKHESINSRKLRIVNDGSKPVCIAVRVIDLTHLDGNRCVSLKFTIGGRPLAELYEHLASNPEAATEAKEVTESEDLDADIQTYVPSEEGLDHLFADNAPRKCERVWYPLPDPQLYYVPPFKRTPPTRSSVSPDRATSPEQSAPVPPTTVPATPAPSARGLPAGRLTTRPGLAGAPSGVSGGLPPYGAQSTVPVMVINPAHVSPAAAEQYLATILAARAAEKTERELLLTTAEGRAQAAAQESKRLAQLTRAMQPVDSALPPARPFSSTPKAKGMLVWVDKETRAPLRKRSSESALDDLPEDHGDASVRLCSTVTPVDWIAQAPDVDPAVFRVEPGMLTIAGGHAGTFTLIADLEAVEKRGGRANLLLLPYVGNPEAVSQLRQQCTEATNNWNPLIEVGFKPQMPLKLFVRLEAPDTKRLVSVGLPEVLRPREDATATDGTLERVQEILFSASAPMTPASGACISNPASSPTEQSFPLTNTSEHVPLRVVIALSGLSSFTPFEIYATTLPQDGPKSSFIQSSIRPRFTSAPLEVILAPRTTCHVVVKFTPPSPCDLGKWPLVTNLRISARLDVLAAPMHSHGSRSESNPEFMPIRSIYLRANLYRLQLQLLPPNDMMFPPAPVVAFEPPTQRKTVLSNAPNKVLSVGGSANSWLEDVELGWTQLRHYQIQALRVRCPQPVSSSTSLDGSTAILWRIVHLQDPERTLAAMTKRLLQSSGPRASEAKQEALKSTMDPQTLRYLSNPELNPDLDYADDASVFVFSQTWGRVEPITSDQIECEPTQGPSALPFVEKELRVAFVPTRPIKYKSRFALIALNIPASNGADPVPSETFRLRRQSMLSSMEVPRPPGLGPVQLADPTQAPVADVPRTKLKEILASLDGRAGVQVLTGLGPVQAVITLCGQGSTQEAD